MGLKRKARASESSPDISTNADIESGDPPSQKSNKKSRQTTKSSQDNVGNEVYLWPEYFRAVCI